MQFSTFALALALSASMVLSQPIAREPTEYYDGLESRDFEGLEARDIESSLEAREPILGFGKKEPKVDYQQCAVNCANQLAQCKLEHPTFAQNLGACYSQNSQCAIHCRAAMPS